MIMPLAHSAGMRLSAMSLCSVFKFFKVVAGSEGSAGRELKQVTDLINGIAGLVRLDLD